MVGGGDGSKGRVPWRGGKNPKATNETTSEVKSKEADVGPCHSEPMTRVKMEGPNKTVLALGTVL